MMLVQIRQSVRSRALVSSPHAMCRPFLTRDRVGRLIQMTLAIYLLPVLLVVLVITGAGIATLAISRLFGTPVRTPVG